MRRVSNHFLFLNDANKRTLLSTEKSFFSYIYIYIQTILLPNHKEKRTLLPFKALSQLTLSLTSINFILPEAVSLLSKHMRGSLDLVVSWYRSFLQFTLVSGFSAQIVCYKVLPESTVQLCWSNITPVHLSYLISCRNSWRD
jgi:hypothetical protein